MKRKSLFLLLILFMLQLTGCHRRIIPLDSLTSSRDSLERMEKRQIRDSIVYHYRDSVIVRFRDSTVISIRDSIVITKDATGRVLQTERYRDREQTRTSQNNSARHDDTRIIRDRAEKDSVNKTGSTHRTDLKPVPVIREPSPVRAFFQKAGKFLGIITAVVIVLAAVFFLTKICRQK